MRPHIRDMKFLPHNLESQLCVKPARVRPRITPQNPRTLFPGEGRATQHQGPAQTGALCLCRRRHPAQLNRRHPRLIRQLRFEQRSNTKQLPIPKRSEMLRRRQIVPRKRRRLHRAPWTQHRMTQRDGFRRADLTHLDGRDSLGLNTHSRLTVLSFKKPYSVRFYKFVCLNAPLKNLRQPQSNLPSAAATAG